MSTEKKDNTEYKEPEEHPTNSTTDLPPQDADILTEDPVIDRQHTQQKAEAKAGPVPEYQFTAPPPTDQGTATTTEEAEEEIPAYENQSLKDLPESEKMENAGQTCDMIFGVYSFIRNLAGNQFLTIKEKTLRKAEEDGRIDTSIPLMTRAGAVPMLDAILDYNSKVTDQFNVSEKYVEKAKPILQKELARRNIGMTPMQYLGYITVLEFANAGKKFGKLLRAKFEIIEACEMTTAAVRENGGVYPTPPPPPPPPAGEATTVVQQPEQKMSQNNSDRIDSAFSEIQDNRRSVHTNPSVRNMRPTSELPKVVRTRSIARKRKTTKKRRAKKKVVPIIPID